MLFFLDLLKKATNGISNTGLLRARCPICHQTDKYHFSQSKSISHRDIRASWSGKLIVHRPVT